MRVLAHDCLLLGVLGAADTGESHDQSRSFTFRRRSFAAPNRPDPLPPAALVRQVGGSQLSSPRRASLRLMTIDKSGRWWRGTEPSDLDAYLVAYTADGYPCLLYTSRCV